MHDEPRPSAPEGPVFHGSNTAVSDDVRVQMTGVSWHAELPGGFVAPTFEQLRLLSLRHFTFGGEVAEGRLVVSAVVADELLEIFQELFMLRFPIAKMRLVDHYGAEDERSMADNNSSAFNCRLIAGTTRPSNHAQGLAVDINPVQNPYIVRGSVHPAAGTAYADRTHRRPGMFIAGGPEVGAFTRRGWVWGGHWDEPKDYHHFERPIRR